MLKRMLVILLALCPLAVQAQAPKDVDLTVAKGETFSFVEPSGAGKTTTISILPGYLVVNGGTRDEMIADLSGGDILVNDNGRYVSLKDMRARHGGTMPAVPKPKAGGATDPEIEALLDGFPEVMKDQLRARFGKMPKAEARRALNLVRGQMKLPPVAAGAKKEVKAATDDRAVRRSGRTDTKLGYAVAEVFAAGDQIWVTDPANVPGGAAFLAAMTEFGALHGTLTKGLPVQDSSFFRMGEIGGFPIVIMAKNGEVYQFDGVATADVRVPR